MMVERLCVGFKRRLVVVILGMKKERFEAKRFAFEPSVLDVVVGWSVVHELLHRCFGFITVENGLDSAASLSRTHYSCLRQL